MLGQKVTFKWFGNKLKGCVTAIRHDGDLEVTNDRMVATFVVHPNQVVAVENR